MQRRIRLFLIAVSALSAVYVSVPHKPGRVAPNTTTCSPELGFFLDHENMYIAPIQQYTTGSPISGAHQFRPSGANFFSFGVDLAYDGNPYGMMTDPTVPSPAPFWGRLDPYGTLGDSTEPGMTQISPIPFIETAFLARPAFLPEMPDPGAPIGYRFGGRPPDTPDCPLGGANPGGSILLHCAIDLYAIDSLSPYREHLLAANLGTIDNFALGTSIAIAPGTGSQESRTNVLLTTTSSVYCYGAGALCPGTTTSNTLARVGFLSLYRISRNASLGTSATPGYFYIVDGSALFTWGDGNVQDSFFLKNLTQVVGMGRLNCAPGGVHFEPDTRIYTSETGGQSAFTVALTAAPSADVTMTLTSSNPAEGTVSPGTMTFTTSNWNIPQTATVTGVLNPGAVGPQDYAIVSGLTSADSNYDGMPVRQLAATNFKGGGPALSVHNLNLQQGSTLTANIADVSDGTDPAGSLAVSLGSNFESVTVGAPTNTNGAITAPVTVPCGAATTYGSTGPPPRFWQVGVTDSTGNSRSDQLSIAVGAATTPILSYANATAALGGGKTISPTSFDGAASSITASSPTFTGSLSVDSSTGVVTVSNAGPAGDNTINLTTTHRCGGTYVDNASFTLHVNAPPSITPVGTSVQQGSPAMTATLATVSDAETAAGSLAVTAISIPSSVTIGTITNTNGTITAPVSASCGAVTGPRTLTLRVTDGDGASTDADVTIDVTANTPPTLGTYAPTEVKSGDSVNVTPSAPPSDNGSETASVSAPGFSGSISVNSTTGVVGISSAGPAGNYTVTVTATDNCGAVSTATFSLSVYNCSYTIAPAFANVTPAATTGTVNVTTKPACSWTATGSGFVSITGGSSGTGSGTVSYSVTQNSGTTGRTATLTLAGLPFTVTQSAAGFATFAMTATASSFTVAVAWSALPGATSYEVWRADGGGAFHIVTGTGALAYNDISTSPGIGYLYRIYAYGSGGLIAYSNVDLAVPFVYTNLPAPGVTIRAADFNELRQAANAGRAAVGLPPMSFTGVITAGTVIQAIHLTEIRTAVDQARAAAGLAPLTYSDSTVTAGSTPVRAAHVLELRSGLQ